MCIHGPKNLYLGKSTPHPSGQETIPILSLGASPLGIELELPLGSRDIGVDFPWYKFLSPWIPPISTPPPGGRRLINLSPPAGKGEIDFLLLSGWEEIDQSPPIGRMGGD